MDLGAAEVQSFGDQGNGLPGNMAKGVLNRVQQGQQPAALIGMARDQGRYLILNRPLQRHGRTFVAAHAVTRPLGK